MPGTYRIGLHVKLGVVFWLRSEGTLDFLWHRQCRCGPSLVEGEIVELGDDVWRRWAKDGWALLVCLSNRRRARRRRERRVFQRVLVGRGCGRLGGVGTFDVRAHDQLGRDGWIVVLGVQFVNTDVCRNVWVDQLQAEPALEVRRVGSIGAGLE